MTKRKVEAEVEGITLKSGKKGAGLRYQQGMERKDLFGQQDRKSILIYRMSSLCFCSC